MRTRRASRRAGFTMIELALTATIFIVLMGAFIRAVTAMAQVNELGEIETELQAQGERALGQIYEDVGRSGFVTLGVKDYPFLFQDGKPGGGFALHNHAAPTPSNLGPNQELVFVLPVDLDGDDWPDLDLNRQVVWGADEISYVVLSQDGFNRLERRVNAAAPRVLARNVERVRFDDAESSGFAIPLGCLRVTLDLAKRDRDGVVHRRRLQGVFRLRNGVAP